MSVITLKPGLLVNLATRVAGGVSYDREELGGEKSADGVVVSEWKTRKTVEDPAELERATKVRSKCRSLISGACTKSAFGLLCAGDKEKALDDAIKESRELLAAFNESATTIKVSVYVLKGRIAETDQEATRAIASEVKALVDEMREGIGNADIEAVREAASKAKKVGGMLDEASAKKVTAAVEQARAFARDVVKRIAEGEERAEAAANAVRAIKLDALESSRFAFLDLEGPAVVEGEALPAVEARAVDLDEETEAPPSGDGDGEGGAEMKAAAPSEEYARTLDV